MLPQCRDMGVGVIPFSPLERGVITGNKTRDGVRHTVRAANDSYADRTGSAADFDVVDRVREVAGERGLPPAQVALAWLLHQPGVTAPIVGATKVGHVADAVAATEVALSGEEIKRLEEPYVPQVPQGLS
jgi:aryl-alcohol dehydrogenase-like predicted oxidoreductase